MDIAAWLRGLGLEEYEPAFRDNRIGAEILPKLTGEDLREIGVATVSSQAPRSHRSPSRGSCGVGCSEAAVGGTRLSARFSR
jgi:hypothetical protein